jgi:putative copper resistance protein D
VNGIQAALAACRFLQDGSALLLWGAFAYLAMLVPDTLADLTSHRLETTRRVSITVALIATAAMLPLHAANLGRGGADAFDEAALRAVLFQTRVGDAWQYQLAASIALASTTMLPKLARRCATAAAAGLLLASLALTGHAVVPSGGLGIAHRLVDALHVLCAGAWLGALIPLLFTLTALKQPERRVDAVVALRRFSWAGHIAVAGVIATGALNSWLVLGEERVDVTSPYQRLLLCKLVLVAAMTGLALCNRYRWVPQLKRSPATSLTAIRRATVAEIGLGMVVVALVSVFGLLSPS